MITGGGDGFVLGAGVLGTLEGDLCDIDMLAVGAAGGLDGLAGCYGAGFDLGIFTGGAGEGGRYRYSRSLRSGSR